MSTITGTARANRLSAQADGDFVYGLGGSDRLTSPFNATLLSGGDGSDRLTTVLESGDDSSATSFSAEQSGGRGNDVLLTEIDAASPSVANSRASLNGGDGDDRISCSVWLAWSSLSASAVIVGGRGNDTIEASGGAVASASSCTFANDISVGDGDDTITAKTFSAYSGSASDLTNLIVGGGGDDTIRAIATCFSNGSDTATNSIDGGTGSDFIRSVILSSTNSSSTYALSEIDGDDGNDRINLSFDGRGESAVHTTHDAIGGIGNDRITSIVLGSEEAYFAFQSATTLDGGDGNDRLVARTSGAVMEGGPILVGPVYAENDLSGGLGRDTLCATLDVRVEAPGASLFNFLRGGGDNDTLIAEVLVDGRSELNGDAGNDTLTVIGGTRNELYGGSGLDRLVAGSGSDMLSGGAEADRFVFDPTLDQGADTLVDFDGSEDILVFRGIADTGPAGLTDDLDAQAVFQDEGSGLDVVIALDNGTVLTFEGAGTGSVATFADLVDDPLTQLVVEIA